MIFFLCLCFALCVFVCAVYLVVKKPSVQINDHSFVELIEGLGKFEFFLGGNVAFSVAFNIGCHLSYGNIFIKKFFLFKLCATHESKGIPRL